MPKAMVKALREWRRENPKTDFALGFVPYVGTALAADDFIQEPSLLGAAGLALGPLAKSLQKIKALRNITTYHGTKKPWDTDKVVIPETQRYGRVEGDAFYSTTRPETAAAWSVHRPSVDGTYNSWKLEDPEYMLKRGRSALKKKQAIVYEIDIPDEKFSRYLDLSNRKALIAALRDHPKFPEQKLMDYYGTLDEQAAAAKNHLQEVQSWVKNHVGSAKYAQGDPNSARQRLVTRQAYTDAVPYHMTDYATEGDSHKLALDHLRKQFPGLRRSRVDRVVTFDPSDLRVTGLQLPGE